MGVFIEVNGDVFFEGGIDLFLQGFYKLCPPLIRMVILLTITDKDVVFVALDD